MAVVGLLRDLGAEQSLATLIEAESLLNDGSAFVVYLVTQAILLGGDTSASTIVSNVFQYALGGPAFGLLCGVLTVGAMALVYSDMEVEISLTIGAAYLCFWIASSPLAVSGVLAIVVMGLFMAKHRYAVSPSVQPQLAAVWAVLIFIVNIAIFVLSGLIIADKIFGENAQFIRARDVGYAVPAVRPAARRALPDHRPAPPSVPPHQPAPELQRDADAVVERHARQRVAHPRGSSPTCSPATTRCSGTG